MNRELIIIAIIIVLILVVLAFCKVTFIHKTEEERWMEDEEQAEYLKRWEEKYGKKNSN